VSDFTFSSAELAVLINHMTGGRLLEAAPALPELRVDEQTLAAAEEELLDRGLLVSLPFEEVSGVTSQLASVLSAAITPDRVCIVRTVHGDHTDPPVFFSFTPECITRNQVDEQGQHVFTELADQEEAVAAILAAGGAAEKASAKQGAAKKAPAKKSKAAAKSRPLADLLKDASRLVMLMVVTDPAEPEAAAASLSWLETDVGLWLVDGASDGEAPLATPVGEKALRQRVAAAAEGEE
jgi:hypothetical protein